MRYLIVDTETDGLPERFESGASRVDNWPRVVQLAFMLMDTRKRKLSEVDLLVRPEGFEVPEESTKVHGITHDQAMAEGVSIQEALMVFQSFLAMRPLTLVAHNLPFDGNVLAAEGKRAGIALDFKNGLETADTMKLAQAHFKLRTRPTLTNTYKKLFNKTFDGAHNALVDVKACADVLFALKQQTEISQSTLY